MVFVCVLTAIGCSTENMNYIIENKPSVTGIVEEVHSDHIIMHSDTADGYPNGSRWSISLNVENIDSCTELAVGDEIVVYHDGNVMETDPLKVGTVYAITLKTPANAKRIGTTDENEAGSNDTVLTEPPALTVTCGKNSVEALRGTTSWIYHNEDGTSTGVNTDSMHPLQAKEYMTALELVPTPISSIDPLKAYFQWNIMPDKVLVRYWHEDCWEQFAAESKELPVTIQTVDSDVETAPIISADLKDGNYIYEIVAEWNRAERYSGKAYYSFYTTKPTM